MGYGYFGSRSYERAFYAVARFATLAAIGRNPLIFCQADDLSSLFLQTTSEGGRYEMCVRAIRSIEVCLV